MQKCIKLCIVFLITFRAFARGATSMPSAPDIVAMVGSAAITRELIEPTEAQVENQFWIEHNRASVSPEDDEELIHCKIKLEQILFSRALHKEILEHVATAYGILISNSDVDNDCNAFFPDKKVDAIRVHIANQLAAVEAVVVDRQEPDRVYDAKMRNQISKQEWSRLLFVWRKHSIREEIHASLTLSLSDYRKHGGDSGMWNACRHNLLVKRVSDRIDQELSADDDVYAKLAVAMKSSEGVRIVDHNDPIAYYRNAQDSWWRKKAKALGIKIISIELQVVASSMFSPGGYGEP